MEGFTQYKGQLTLEFDAVARHFNYALVHYTYPRQWEPQSVSIEPGDRLVIRSPLDGSIVIQRDVEFDYKSYQVMSHETGTMHQMVQNQPVNGILTDIEPTYWLNLFLNGYVADLYKANTDEVEEGG